MMNSVIAGLFFASYLPLLVSPQSWPGLEELPLLAEKHELAKPTENLARLIAVYVKAQRTDGYLPAIRAMMRKPLSAPGFAIALTDKLHAAASTKEADLGAILAEGGRLLDWKMEATENEPPTDFESLAKLLLAAKEHVDAAYAPLGEGERARLRPALARLLDSFVEHIYVYKDQGHIACFEQMEKIDWKELGKAAELLAPLASRSVRLALQKEARGMRGIKTRVPGVTGPLLYAKKSEVGWILVGGRGKNHYETPAAFILDLGGNDSYAGVSTRSDADQAVNVVIDVTGDDNYEATAHFAQGCGLLGVSLLVDFRGKDRYRGTRAAQGTGVGGIGMLVDLQGQDIYEGDAYVQGAGCLGIGLLLDRAGNDQMQAKINSQGFAWPISVGLLLDLAGNDRRRATGKYPSSYGTKGEFAGNSMGAALGFRNLAAGGFGLLLDGGGDDRSEVGEFGFGLGYYLGCGIVRDWGGDDQVRASRYGIAAGAHMAIGIVLDDSGDDLYENPHTAGIAGNWDQTLSFLLDAKGNDRYVGQGISLGSATICSLAALVDGDGVDRYETKGKLCFGNAGHPQDIPRKLQSVAYFLDLGGDVDLYPKTQLSPAPANDLECRRRNLDRDKSGEHLTGLGVFLDR